MSSKRLSPAANLLRSSRLFSIPPPLPNPSNSAVTGITGSRLSDSATQSHPTIQALAAPPTSLARGDWGLKRSLPLRSTTSSSTPSFRIRSLDTIEHVTEFESAGDHVVSLEKFQELGIPMTVDVGLVSKASNSQKLYKSAFESKIDNTDPSIAQVRDGRKRWKHQGPWLSGMSESAFQQYIQKELKGRSDEFMAFLREDYALKRLAELRAKDQAEGKERRASHDVTEEEFALYVRRLRSSFNTISDLSTLITRFLDLAQNLSTPTGTPLHISDQAKALTNSQPPNSCHPSAGLSYIRTNAYLHNHPIAGPQRDGIPIESRVLSIDHDRRTGSRRGLVGIGGFVGILPDARPQNRRPVYSAEEQNDRKISDSSADRTRARIGASLPGGSRVWMGALRAEVNHNRDVSITSIDSDNVSINVKTGDAFTALRPTSRTSDSALKTRQQQETKKEQDDAEAIMRAVRGRLAGEPQR